MTTVFGSILQMNGNQPKCLQFINAFACHEQNLRSYQKSIFSLFPLFNENKYTSYFDTFFSPHHAAHKNFLYFESMIFSCKVNFFLFIFSFAQIFSSEFFLLPKFSHPNFLFCSNFFIRIFSFGQFFHPNFFFLSNFLIRIFSFWQIFSSKFFLLVNFFIQIFPFGPNFFIQIFSFGKFFIRIFCFGPNFFIQIFSLIKFFHPHFFFWSNFLIRIFSFWQIFRPNLFQFFCPTGATCSGHRTRTAQRRPVDCHVQPQPSRRRRLGSQHAQPIPPPQQSRPSRKWWLCPTHRARLRHPQIPGRGGARWRRRTAPPPPPRPEQQPQHLHTATTGHTAHRHDHGTGESRVTQCFCRRGPPADAAAPVHRPWRRRRCRGHVCAKCLLPLWRDPRIVRRAGHTPPTAASAGDAAAASATHWRQPAPLSVAVPAGRSRVFLGAVEVSVCSSTNGKCLHSSTKSACGVFLCLTTLEGLRFFSFLRLSSFSGWRFFAVVGIKYKALRVEYVLKIKK